MAKTKLNASSQTNDDDYSSEIDEFIAQRQ